MNRKVLVVALFLVLALLVLTLAGMAAGRDDPAADNLRPSMSGDFAATHFAFIGPQAPSITVPSAHWGT